MINLQTIEIAATFIFVLLCKDVVSSCVSGFIFYIDRDFLEGDEVYMGSDKCIIIKISLLKTILYSQTNNQWIFVKNEEIRKILKKDKADAPKKINKILLRIYKQELKMIRR